MLLVNTGTASRFAAEPGRHESAVVQGGIWLDLLDASDEERSLAENAAGLRVPSRTELAEIETSSRLATRNGVLTLSTPMIARSEGDHPLIAPLGFVLSPDRLLTVRYTPLKAFDAYAERFARAEAEERSSGGALVGLLEALVDRIADILERIGSELDGLSKAVFRADPQPGRGLALQDARLREMLRAIGRTGDLISHIRDSLLGVGRIVGFVPEMARWLPQELRPRFVTLRQDIGSLSDYDAQLANKVQFLLDATLGFINIQQNNVMKVLTVASIAGIPPVLIAGIYGMNFKLMPELQWHWGYAYGLGVIALSGVLPLIWFRRRGWI